MNLLKRYLFSPSKALNDEKIRQISLSVGFNVLSKFVTMLVAFLSIRFTLPYLGSEKFGIWMTLSSLTYIFSFLDFGVGNALTNRVVKAAIENEERLQLVVTNGVCLLAIFGFSIGLLLVFGASIFNWRLVFQTIDGPLFDEVRVSSMVFSAIFGLGMLALGLQKICLGLQRVYYAHIATIISGLLSLGFLFVAREHRYGIAVLLVGTYGLQTMGALALLVVLQLKGIFRPSLLFKISMDEMKYLFQTGGLFFVLQIGGMACFGMDNFIVSSTVGASSVVLLGISQRVFQFVSQPLQILNAPLWPAYADARNRNDIKFIRKMLRVSLFGTIALGTLGVLVILVLKNRIIPWITKDVIQIPSSLFVLYGIWVVFEAFGNALSVFLNGCHVVKEQVITVIILSLVIFPCKYISCLKWGVEGLVGATIAIYVLVVGTMYGVVFRKNIQGKVT